MPDESTRTLVFQQFMQPDLVCDFEDPLVQQALPKYVLDAVRELFSPAYDMGMVSVTLADGPSATFYVKEDAEARTGRQIALKPAAEVFGGPPLPDSKQAAFLREAAYKIDEGIKP